MHMMTAKAFISIKAVKGCNYCIYFTTAPRSPGIAISPADVPDTGWAVDQPSSNQTPPGSSCSALSAGAPSSQAPPTTGLPVSPQPVPSSFHPPTIRDGHGRTQRCASVYQLKSLNTQRCVSPFSNLKLYPGVVLFLRLALPPSFLAHSPTARFV